MKKFLAAVLLAALTPALSGCGSLYTNYREVEQLLVVQTMGLDTLPGGVRLTLAAPSTARQEDSPVYLSGVGESVSTAIERVYNYSSEEELFTAHINYLVLGEEAAEKGIGDTLNYLCRSPEMRIDTPLFVVKNCSAYDLISGVIGSGTGICEVLQSVKTNAEERGDSTVFTAAQALRSLNRYGSTLLCALEYSPSDEVSGQGSGTGEAGGMTAAVNGYAILKEGKLQGYIDRDKALGASFLMNLVAVSEIVVRDMNGQPVTLELSQGGTKLQPVWEKDGSLRGLNISAQATASILEIGGGEPEADEGEYEDYITARLEDAVSQRIEAVLRLSKSLRADFLGLGGQVELADPVKFRNLKESFPELLPELEMRVSVSGELSHTNNLKE